jgi:hypothetical protein
LFTPLRCRLANILGVLVVAQHAQPHAHYHRAMPSHQRAERLLIALVGKAREEFAVRRLLLVLLVRDFADDTQNGRWLSRSQGFTPVGLSHSLSN